MTIRQVVHITKVHNKFHKMERLRNIYDAQVASPGCEENAYRDYLNNLKYD